MLSKNAIGNLINRYRAVLKKCRLINVFGSLVIPGMMFSAATSMGADITTHTDITSGKITTSSDDVYKNIHYKDTGYGGAFRVTSTGQLEVVTGTYFKNNDAQAGGAIIIGTSAGDVTVSGAVFDGNHAKYDGGAIAGYNALTITNSTFKNNTAQYDNDGTGNWNVPVSDDEAIGGGAIALGSVSSTKVDSIEYCYFESNKSGFNGGAIGTRLAAKIGDPQSKNDNSKATYSIAAMFTKNEAAKSGGAVYNTFYKDYDSSLGSGVLVIGLFTENKAGVDGGAVFNDGTSDKNGKGGVMTISGSAFIGNKAAENGGAVYNTGTLTVSDSSFTGNTAENGAGGAIVSGTSSKNLTIKNTAFGGDNAAEGNHAKYDGGAIAGYNALTITGSTFKNNTAQYDNDGAGNWNVPVTDDEPVGGGAIALGSLSKTQITTSTFNYNKSGKQGGAIGTRLAINIDNQTKNNNSEAALSITADFKGNEAAYSGGAIYNTFYKNAGSSPDDGVLVTGSNFTENKAGADGGAVFNDGTNDKNGKGGVMTISGSAFTDNTAGTNGGAVYNTGTQTVSGSSFTGNIAGTNGGAVYNTGTQTVSASSFTGNIAAENGGAVYNTGTQTVSDSSFTGNIAGTNGGAVYNTGMLNFKGTNIFGDASDTKKHNKANNVANDIYNAGTIVAADGTTTLYGGLEQESTGTFKIESGAALNLVGTSNIGGAFTVKSGGTANLNGIVTFVKGTISNAGAITLERDANVVLVDSAYSHSSDTAYLDFKGGLKIADFKNFLNIVTKEKIIKGLLKETTKVSTSTLILRSQGIFSNDQYTTADLANAKTKLFGDATHTDFILTFQGATLKLASGEKIAAKNTSAAEGTAVITNLHVINKSNGEIKTAAPLQEWGIVPIISSNGQTANVSSVNVKQSRFDLQSLQVRSSSQTNLTISDGSIVSFSGAGLIVNESNKVLKTDLTIKDSSSLFIAGNSAGKTMEIASIKADGTGNSTLTILQDAALKTGSIKTAANANDMNITVAGKLNVSGQVQAQELTAAGGTIKADSLSLKGDLKLVSGSSAKINKITLTSGTSEDPNLIIVGSDTEQKGGDTLSVGSMTLPANVYLIVDPAWGQNSSRVAVENLGSILGNMSFKGRIGVAQNSVLALGTEDTDWLNTSLSEVKAAGGSKIDTLAKKGITSAFGLYKSLDLSNDGVLYVDGSKNESNIKGAVWLQDEGSVYFGSNSLFVVNGEMNGITANVPALKAKNITVENGAKLHISKAKGGSTYYIANAAKSLTINGDAWRDKNLTNSLLISATLEKDDHNVWVAIEQTSLDLPKMEPALLREVNKLLESGMDEDSDNMALKFISRAANRGLSADAATATIEGAAKIAFAGAVPQMNLDLAQRMNSALASRDFLSANPGTGVASGNTENGFALWALPTYQYSRGHNFKSANFKSGYESNAGGMALGGDYTFNNSLRLGIALNGGGGKIESNGEFNETKNDMNYIGVNAYASWKLNKFSLFGQVGWLRTDNDLSQKTPAVMGLGDSKADPDSNVFTFGLRASYQFAAELCAVVPYIGLDYYHVRTSSFTVKNSGMDMFHNGAIESDFLQIPIGINMKKVITEAGGWNVKAALDLAVIPNIGNHTGSQDIRINGLTSTGQITQVISDKCTGRAIVGFEVQKGNFGLGLNYTFQGGSHTINHGVQGMINYKF